MTDAGKSYQPVVLVVDDDEDVRDTTAHMLRARGFHVLTAADQTSALDACRSHGGRVDALVADLSLPGDTRGNLARSITMAYPDVKVLYASGIPRHIALSSGIVRADAPYLEKPVDPDVLSSLLRTLLPGR